MIIKKERKEGEREEKEYCLDVVQGSRFKGSRFQRSIYLSIGFVLFCFEGRGGSIQFEEL